MIVNSVWYKVKPGTRDELLEMAKTAVEETRKEKGNIKYVQFPSPENDTDMFVYEEWETIEDLMAHSQAPHHLAFAEKRKPLLIEGSYTFTIYEAKVLKQG